MLGLVIALAGVAPAAHAAEAESFLLPGIDMRSIAFTVGAWCRYRVVDEAMDESDTTLVYLAVVGSEKTAAGTAYWLEVESRVPGRGSAERDAARALVDERIHTMADGDSLHAYISRFYTMKGSDAPQKGDPADLKKLTLVSPATSSDWKTESGAPVETPAGKFTCEHRVFDRSDARDVPSGRVVIKQKRTDHVEIFTAPSVPLFHLVKSEIDRTRESRTVPAIKGIPETGPRRSRTTSVLIAHGTNAKPIIHVR
ncbi:MAG TPA: hypothetical protein VJS69_08805 [Candidatus Krumholzibacteria bacterium]|nr:hypothetical protein [Candidatus Krumholzibacteria bacterium]